MTKEENAAWHPNVIPASTESALSALRDAGLLDAFYLAGGTALALQYGHRLSLDLDFFSREHFGEESLLARLKDIPGFALVSKAPYPPLGGTAMNGLFKLWDAVAESVALIMIVVTTIGTMVRLIEFARAIKRILLVLGCLALLLILPPIILKLWCSLLIWQQIGVIVVFTCIAVIALNRRKLRNWRKSRGPH